MHAELRRKGHGINRKRVERIMRERDIRGITRRRRRHLTKQDAMAAPAPDLVGRVFTKYLRGRPGLRAGEESDPCGAGQETGFRPQGESPPT
ncbi:hypothetical protein GCM10022206_08020 [Streptomyces chiangmaiensis]